MKGITIDYKKRLAEEPGKGHNRWHEAIPPVVEAAPGEEVEIRPATRSTARSPRRPRPTICARST